MPWSSAVKRQNSAHQRTLQAIETALTQVQRRQSGGRAEDEGEKRQSSMQKMGFFELLMDDDADKSPGSSPGRPSRHGSNGILPGWGIRHHSQPDLMESELTRGGAGEGGGLQPPVRRLSEASVVGVGAGGEEKRTSVMVGAGATRPADKHGGVSSPKYKSQQTLLALNAKLFGYTPASSGDALTSTYGGGVLARVDGGEEGRSVAMIHPLSPFRTRWDFLAMTLALIIIFLVPFRVCFDRAFNDEEILTYDTALLTFDAFFLIDIILNFNTGRIHDEDRVVVMSRKKVAHMYLRGWLAIDILSSFPWFLLEIALDSSSPRRRLSELPPGLLILRLLRCLKLFRLSHIARHAAVAREKLAVGSSHVYIAGLISAFTIFSHWNACAQFLVVEIDGFREDSWVVREGMVDPATLEVLTTSNVLYAWSLFKALSHMLSIGYGHGDTPDTMAEVIATMVSMVLGASVYACLVGIITALSMHVGQDQLMYSQRLDRVNRLMARMALPAELRTAVRDSYEHRKRTHRLQDDSETLRDLPLPLKTDIAMHNCRELLQSVPFFADNDAGFIASIVTMLKPTMFLPGQVIFSEGSIGQEMFFVRSGEVEISVAGRIAAVLPPGSYFGEIALLTRTRRTATVRCTRNDPCELYSLSISDFRDVEAVYPEVREALQVVAEHRLTALEFLVGPETSDDFSAGVVQGTCPSEETECRRATRSSVAGGRPHAQEHLSDSETDVSPRGRLSESRLRRLNTLEKYVSLQGPGSRILFGDLYRHIRHRRRRSSGARLSLGATGPEEKIRRSRPSTSQHALDRRSSPEPSSSFPAPPPTTFSSATAKGPGSKGADKTKAPFIREILDMEQRFGNDPRRKKTINGQDVLFPLFMPTTNPFVSHQDGAAPPRADRAAPSATTSAETVAAVASAEGAANEKGKTPKNEAADPLGDDRASSDGQRAAQAGVRQGVSPLEVNDSRRAGLLTRPDGRVQASAGPIAQTSPRWEGAVQARFKNRSCSLFQRPASPP